MREKSLNWLVHLAANRRWTVFIVSLLTTLVLGAASGKLEVDVRWSALLPQSLPVVQEFEKIDANFLQPGNMLVAISGPDAVTLEKLTDEVEALLQKDLVCAPSVDAETCEKTQRYGRHVYGKLPEQWIKQHALRLAKPNDARRLGSLLGDPKLLPFITHMNDDFEAEYSDSENVKNQEPQIVGSLDAVLGLVEALQDAADGKVDEAQNQRVVRDLTVGRPYMLSLDKTMSLLMVAPSFATDDFESAPLMDKRIEAILAPLAEQYPEYRIERTGMFAIGRDEMDSIGPETQMITMVALLLLFLLLAWNFRSVTTPAMALLPIIVGIIWAMGVIALTLGKLNLITVMIMVVLLGLGIDFAIHMANRFTEEISSGKSVEEALRLAIGHTGIGIITGAVTTSVAFFTLMIADTKGISEFGFCAGVGVLTTLAAVMWMLPAMLAASASRRAKRGKPPAAAHDFALLGRLAVLMGRWRLGVIGVGAVAGGLGLLAANNLQWEWDFMELEPEGLRSIELQDEIIEKYKMSVSFAMLTTDSVEESRSLRKKFKSKRLVGDVDDISLWVSRPDFSKNLPHIRKLREDLGQPGGAATFAFDLDGTDDASDGGNAEHRRMLAAELDRMWANLVEIQALSFTGGQDRVVEKTTQLVATRKHRDSGLLKRIASRFEAGESINWAVVDTFAGSFEKRMRANAVAMAAGEEPVTVEMIPPKTAARYTSKNTDAFLMQFFPRENLYNREKLEAFQEMAASVHPNVTGTPQMILEMSRETMREGGIAVVLALLVILIVLLIDFRRPLVAVLTFVPLLVGLAITFGIMWLLDEKLNYINMIGLPAIVGIGVDDGVHFFHRFMREGRGGMERAVTSVGRAMFMSSLTTMIGFGSLMLYLMRGMASLGLLLFVGVGACFIVSVTLLPALASLFEDRIITSESTGDR